jgi:hypothetical protein
MVRFSKNKKIRVSIANLCVLQHVLWESNGPLFPLLTVGPNRGVL